MSGTALDHPLVRGYLQELDSALAELPAAQASELTEQITAHLDDALAPDTDDEEVAAVLRRLGRPADLAAEAAASTGSGAGTAASPAGRRRRRLGRRSWTAIGAAVAIVAAVAAVIGYVVVVKSITPIQARGPSSWWFRQDVARATYAEADGARQTSVPIRSGQMQGLAVTLYNPTDWTQTILGQWDGSNAPGNAERSRITVATSSGRDFRSLRYARPGSIPPHQSRWVRLMWISNACLDKGTGQGNDGLALQVRVGGLDRVENISLRQGWYVMGPNQGPCD
jgi:hypothetical protein